MIVVYIDERVYRLSIGWSVYTGIGHSETVVAARENGLDELIIFGQKGAYDTLLGHEGGAKKGQGAAPRHSALGETLKEMDIFENCATYSVYA